MGAFPRIAVGTIQPAADPTAMLWALMDSLERSRWRVQSFLSRACFAPRDGATAITGLSPRQLDSWLMSESECRAAFVRGINSSDLAIVEGRYDSAGSKSDAVGGSLDTLCGWLDLPRVAVIDARQLAPCQMPERPAMLDGLLFDRVADTAELCKLQTLFGCLWNVPVLGWLPELPGLREAIYQTQRGVQPALDVCHALGNHLKRNSQLERIYRLASRPSLIEDAPPRCTPCSHRDLVRVAVAYDDAFRGYFPDTLDALETAGATICDFSPLRDERLPYHCDVVYIGCGHPERFACELAENDCMMLALKSHVCTGKRLYAECGGLAYLSEKIETSDGEILPMAGLLPLVAHYHAEAPPPQPVEVTLECDTWLGRQGTRCRGYRNGAWSFAPRDPGLGCVHETAHQSDILRHCRAIGSGMHLNFAAQPHLLESFFEPHAVHGQRMRWAAV